LPEATGRLSSAPIQAPPVGWDWRAQTNRGGPGAVDGGFVPHGR
jgi:hypothetical protein